LDDLDVYEVLSHEFALAYGAKEADDCHDRRLKRQREDDPHEVGGHQVSRELRHVLHVLVELSRRVGQVAVVDRQNDAANCKEESRATTSNLLVRPLDAFLSEFE